MLMVRFATVNKLRIPTARFPMREISRWETPRQRNTDCLTQIGWLPCVAMIATTVMRFVSAASEPSAELVALGGSVQALE
jgi:hypothetical protein